MSSVLVTGGSGFLGVHVVRALASEGYSVCSLDRSPPPSGFPADAEAVLGSVFDRSLLEARCRASDVVVHLACSTVPASSEADRIGDVHANVEGCVAVAEAAVSGGVARVVFASSGGTVYGEPRFLPIPEEHPTDPFSSHGVMKLACEGYLRAIGRLHGMQVTILRLANPYGPGQTPGRGQGFVGSALHRLLNREAIELWGDGSVVRDFLYVSDAAEAFERACASGTTVGTFNIGSGVGHSLAEVLAVLQSIVDREAEVRHLPPRPIDVRANVLAVDRASAALGWHPRTPLDVGIRRTLDWIRSPP